MTHQLLARYDIADQSRWQAAFHADAEDRGNASLTVLQVWREGAGRVWVLYQVANPAKAQDYVSGAGQTFTGQAGVTNAEFHMLETT